MSYLCFSSSVAGTNRSESDFRLRLLLSSSATVAKSPALCFCGLRSEALKLGAKSNRWKVVADAVSSGNGSGSDGFDYDLVIIGAGVGGHGAALHAIEKGLKTVIIEGDAVGGTCVNRGCVASKALLSVSGRMRELQDEHRMNILKTKK